MAERVNEQKNASCKLYFRAVLLMSCASALCLMLGATHLVTHGVTFEEQSALAHLQASLQTRFVWLSENRVPFRKYRRLASLKIIAPKTSYFRDTMPWNRHLEDLRASHPSTRNSFEIKNTASWSSHHNKTNRVCHLAYPVCLVEVAGKRGIKQLITVFHDAPEKKRFWGM